MLSGSGTHRTLSRRRDQKERGWLRAATRGVELFETYAPFEPQLHDGGHRPDLP